MIYAVARRHPKMVRHLLEAGAEFDNEFHFEGICDLKPLALAAHHGDREIVLALLEYGAKVDALAEMEGYGMATSLMIAVWRGHVDVVKSLLKKGADPTWIDEEDLTALERARALRVCLVINDRSENIPKRSHFSII